MRTHVSEQGYKTVHANGIDFAYYESGDGPLVLLMHGFPDTAHTWDDVRPVLAAAGYRAVAPFLRGYAPTSIPDRDADYRTLGEDTVALIEALGHKTAILVGHDWGSLSVIAAASLAPERVDKLVHIAVPHPAGIKPNLGLLWNVRHFVGLRLPGALKRFAANDYAGVDRLYQRWSPGWDYPKEEVEAAKNAFAAPGSCNAALGYYRAISPVIPGFMKATINVPTLAIAGADDPNLPVPAYHDAARRFSGPYDVVAIGGGHFCHRESPKAFERALLDFIGKPQ